MKKHLLLLTMAASIGMSAQAQGTTGDRLLAIWHGIGTAAGAYQSKDSQNYTYSGTRGGNLLQAPVYDLRTYDTFDAATPAYKHVAKELRTYDAINRLLSAEFDRLDLPLSSPLVPVNLKTYTYTNGPSVISYVELWKSGPAGALRNSHLNTYSDTLVVLQDWDNATSTYLNTYQYRYTRNAAGMVTEIDTYSWTNNAWQHSAQNIYTYDAAGNMTMWSSVVGFIFTFSYNSANQKTSYVNKKYAGSANVDSTIYAAPGNDNDLLPSLYFTSAGIGWTPSERYTYSYTNHNGVASKLTEQYINGTWSYKQRTTYRYDNLDREIEASSQSWISGAWAITTADESYHYYWEQYSLAVLNAATGAVSTIMMFPVPADHLITLRMENALPQSFRALITDATGKTVRRWTDKASAGIYTKEIDTHSLPAGAYFLSIQSDAGSLSKAFTVQH